MKIVFPSEVLEVKMPTSLYNDLQDLAEARGTSIEDVVCDCLIDFVTEYKLSEKKEPEIAIRLSQAFMKVDKHFILEG